MPTITITKSYADGDVLTESDLDNIRTDVTTFLNTTKIDADNIQDAAISAAKLANNAVTTDKILDANVTTAKIADNAVTAAKIAEIAQGFVGEVKAFHTFNGTVSIPRGWMIENGNVVNQSNYDAIHGAGAYTSDGISSSPILNKNLPNMTNKYIIGSGSTTQDGSSAITSVGNSGSQIALNHTHTTNHNHRWYFTEDENPGSTDEEFRSHTFTSSGSEVNIESLPSEISQDTLVGNTHLVTGDSGSIVAAGLSSFADDDGTVSLYTDNDATASSSALSATQDIRPESIQHIYIIKVI